MAKEHTIGNVTRLFLGFISWNERQLRRVVYSWHILSREVDVTKLQIHDLELYWTDLLWREAGWSAWVIGPPSWTHRQWYKASLTFSLALDIFEIAILRPTLGINENGKQFCKLHDLSLKCHFGPLLCDTTFSIRRKMFISSVTLVKIYVTSSKHEKVVPTWA